MEFLQRQASEFNLQNSKALHRKNLISISFPMNYDTRNTNNLYKRITFSDKDSFSNLTSKTNSRQGRTASLNSRQKCFESSSSSRLNELRADLLNSFSTIDTNDLINTSINNKLDIHQKIMSKAINSLRVFFCKKYFLFVFTKILEKTYTSQ